MKPEIKEALRIQPINFIKEEVEETAERCTINAPITSTLSQNAADTLSSTCATTVSTMNMSSNKANSTVPVQNPCKSTNPMRKMLSAQEYNAGKAMVMDKIKSALLPQPKSPVYIRPSLKRTSCSHKKVCEGTIPCKQKYYSHSQIPQGITCEGHNPHCLKCSNQAVRNQSFSPPILGYPQTGQGDASHFTACNMHGIPQNNRSPRVNHVPTCVGSANGSRNATTKWCGDITVGSTKESTVNLPSNLGPGSVINVEIPQKKMHQTIIVNGSLNNCVINFNM